MEGLVMGASRRAALGGLGLEFGKMQDLDEGQVALGHRAN